jgi:hypothetical protein
MDQTTREATIARRLPTVPPKFRKQYLRVLSGKASPRVAIKINCLECVGFSANEVKECTALACPMHRYRPFQTS